MAQQSLVIVSPLGPVAAKALDHIYLGSALDMLLGGIPNATFGPDRGCADRRPADHLRPLGGNVKPATLSAASYGGVAGQVAISGNIANLTLIADTGSIGQAGRSRHRSGGQ